MKARDFERLIFNPFHLSKILQHFISGVISVNKNGIKTELINLALPFVLNENLSQKLQTLNKNSKFSSILDNKDFQVFFIQINDHIEATRKKTKHGLILLSSQAQLQISNYINIENEGMIHYSTEADIELRKVFKSAFILGVLLAKEQHTTIMNKLRITQI